MGLDLSKLTPAPWDSVGPCATLRTDEGPYLLIHDMKEVGRFQREEDCDAAALARNAFDVMMRRGWHATRHEEEDGLDGLAGLNGSWGGSGGGSRGGSLGGSWVVWGWQFPNCVIRASDPFTVLVEADRWLTEREADGAKERWKSEKSDAGDSGVVNSGENKSANG